MVWRNMGEIAAVDASSAMASHGTCERRQLHFAGFTVDLACLTLERDNGTIELRRQSFDVLRYLVEHPGRVITKEELILQVWRRALVSDDSLVQCIKDIRIATGDSDHQIVRTVSRRGYVFVPEVTQSLGDATGVKFKVRYAKSGDIHIAYQTWGQGPLDLVFFPGFVGHIETLWSEPGLARFLWEMGRFARVVLFDKRGTGMSDRVEKMPGMDERVDDLRVVMDALRIERAAIFGASEGGSLAAYFAATHPHRCHSLLLYGAFARFASWIPTDKGLQELLDYIDTAWGSGRSLASFAPSMVGNAAFEAWWGRFERLGASPADAIALMRTNSQIDISNILPAIHVPTLVIHRTDDVTVNIEGGRQLAARIPGARLVELEGVDHLPWVGQNSDEILKLIGRFVGQQQAVPMPGAVLTTVLVMRAERAKGMAHSAACEELVEQQFARFRGQKVRLLRECVIALFDGPSHAIAGALAIRQTLRCAEFKVRICIHIGEVEHADGDVRGGAIDTALSAVEHANAGDVLVSQTVRDLAAGAGLSFEYIGTHALPGAHQNWPLFRVVI